MTGFCCPGCGDPDPTEIVKDKGVIVCNAQCLEKFNSGDIEKQSLQKSVSGSGQIFTNPDTRLSTLALCISAKSLPEVFSIQRILLNKNQPQPKLSSAVLRGCAEKCTVESELSLFSSAIKALEVLEQKSLVVNAPLVGARPAYQPWTPVWLDFFTEDEYTFLYLNTDRSVTPEGTIIPPEYPDHKVHPGDGEFFARLASLPDEIPGTVMLIFANTKVTVHLGSRDVESFFTTPGGRAGHSFATLDDLADLLDLWSYKELLPALITPRWVDRVLPGPDWQRSLKVPAGSRRKEWDVWNALSHNRKYPPHLTVANQYFWRMSHLENTMEMVICEFVDPTITIKKVHHFTYGLKDFELRLVDPVSNQPGLAYIPANESKFQEDMDVATGLEIGAPVFRTVPLSAPPPPPTKSIWWKPWTWFGTELNTGLSVAREFEVDDRNFTRRIREAFELHRGKAAELHFTPSEREIVTAEGYWSLPLIWGYGTVNKKSYQTRAYKDSDLVSLLNPYTNPLFYSLARQKEANMYLGLHDLEQEFQERQHVLLNASKGGEANRLRAEMPKVRNLLNGFLKEDSVKLKLRRLANQPLNNKSSLTFMTLVVSANQLLAIVENERDMIETLTTLNKLWTQIVEDMKEKPPHSQESTEDEEEFEGKIGNPWSVLRGSRRLHKRLELVEEYARRVANHSPAPGLSDKFRKALVDIQHEPHFEDLTLALIALANILISISQTRKSDTDLDSKIIAVQNAWSKHRRISSAKEDYITWAQYGNYLGDMMENPDLPQMSLKHVAKLLASRPSTLLGRTYDKEEYEAMEAEQEEDFDGKSSPIAKGMSVDAHMSTSALTKGLENLKLTMFKIQKDPSAENQKAFIEAMKALASRQHFRVTSPNKKVLASLQMSLQILAHHILSFIKDRYGRINLDLAKTVAGQWMELYDLKPHQLAIEQYWLQLATALAHSAAGGTDIMRYSLVEVIKALGGKLKQ